MEEPYTQGGYGNGYLGACLYGAQGFYRVEALYLHGYPAATGVHTCTKRPDEDSPHIAFLSAHPVNEFSGKEACEGIEEREEARYRSIVVIGPVEFGGNEIFPCQG